VDERRGIDDPERRETPRGGRSEPRWLHLNRYSDSDRLTARIASVAFAQPA
jgi:hypothetical protein